MIRNRFLFVGAILSAIAALMHVAIIFGGPEWYRFFGAGEELATLDAAGSPVPDLITLGIATALGGWALYALSGAGVIRRLPLLRLVLCLITAVYLLRGLAVLPLAVMQPAALTPFAWWSSLICLGYGAVHLIGLVSGWRELAPVRRTAVAGGGR
ncbi:MAG TPA: hypothetical protein VEY50_02625 [Lysobacter sp.]|nr:hypothetical protein [Lysobacter sp.]